MFFSPNSERPLVESNPSATLNDRIDQEYEPTFRRTKAWRHRNQGLIMRIIII